MRQVSKAIAGRGCDASAPIINYVPCERFNRLILHRSVWCLVDDPQESAGSTICQHKQIMRFESARIPIGKHGGEHHALWTHTEITKETSGKPTKI